VKPTLGVQIYKYIMNEVDFVIFDLPGQDKLRESWYNKSFEPNGIIFVIDCTATLNSQTNARKEFDKLTSFFIKTENPTSIPILILGNKTDIAKSYRGVLQDIFWDIGKFNYQLGYCSAKENDGIKENFAWLAGEIVRINLEH
jgi:signal recognition particle receptor subunit beta